MIHIESSVAVGVSPEAAAGARVHAVVEGEPSGFCRVAKPSMRWMVKRSMDADYRRLEALLESG
jgi:hypothetical protein